MEGRIREIQDRTRAIVRNAMDTTQTQNDISLQDTLQRFVAFQTPTREARVVLPRVERRGRRTASHINLRLVAVPYGILNIVPAQIPRFTDMHRLGKANDGNPVRMSADMSEQEMDRLVRGWFPALGDVPFRFCKATGNRNTLQELPGRTPRTLRDQGNMKKSALYIQPLQPLLADNENSRSPPPNDLVNPTPPVNHETVRPQPVDEEGREIQREHVALELDQPLLADHENSRSPPPNDLVNPTPPVNHETVRPQPVDEEGREIQREHVALELDQDEELPVMVRSSRRRMRRNRLRLNRSPVYEALGTPTVSRRIQPETVTSTSLRAQQDLAYLESLATDQQRSAQLRQAALLRRQSRAAWRANQNAAREQQQQERERKLERVGDEPADGPAVLTISFTIPGEDERLNRRFNFNAKVQTIFDYIEGSTTITSAKLVAAPNRVLQSDGDQSIAMAIGQETTRVHLNVEDTEEESTPIVIDDDSSDVSHIDDPTGPVTPVFDLVALQDRRTEHIQYLSTTAHIVVERNNILQSVLDNYRRDPDLPHKKLVVSFAGERGVDADGITREMLQLFFKELLAKHFKGAIQKVPSMDHRILDSDLFEVVGRVLAHGFVLVGYWPIELCLASTVVALTGSVSKELAMHSFLELSSHDDQTHLRQLIHQETYHLVPDMTRLRVLSAYDCRQDIAQATALPVLQEVALLQTVFQPYFPLLQIARGLRCHTTLWNNVSEETLRNLYHSLTPSAEKLLSLITVDFSADVDNRYVEERVVGFLKTFLSSLQREDLQKVLVFWTASNVLYVGEELNVSFNSVQGLARRPTAMTCSSTLTISRYYISQEEFSADMMAMLSDEANVFDTL